MLKELYHIFLELFRRQGISISNLISGLCIMLVWLISGVILILDYSFLWLNSIPSHEHVLIYLFSYSGTISFFSVLCMCDFPRCYWFPSKMLADFHIRTQWMGGPGTTQDLMPLGCGVLVILLCLEFSKYLLPGSEKTFFVSYCPVSLPCQSSQEN